MNCVEDILFSSLFKRFIARYLQRNNILVWFAIYFFQHKNLLSRLMTWNGNNSYCRLGMEHDQKETKSTS